jgi:hypothetical protein
MNSPESTQVIMRYLARSARARTYSASTRQKRREGNTAIMVKTVNHFCGFVNTEL